MSTLTHPGRQASVIRTRPAPGHVRLTPRGRAAALLGLVVLLCGAFAFGRSASEASVKGAPAPAPQQTTVQRGDTLWAVASRISPDDDPRRVVEQLRELNHLSGELQAGQQLLLPAVA